MAEPHATVSVGMPVYNGAAWLREAAEAILVQTRGDLELVISDNASTDATPAIGQELAAADARVRFVRREVNEGATANYNAVFELARGRFFKWASCNDYCAPTFLERCLEVLEGDDTIVLAYPRAALFDQEPSDARPWEDNLHLDSDDPFARFSEFLEHVRLNNVMNGVMRREALAKTALMRPYFSSDTWLMAELALHGKFHEVPEQLFFRRMSAQSATKMKSSSEITRHWRPDMRPVHLSVTRGILQLYGAAFRAPIGWRSRSRIVRLLARRAIWSRQDMLRELLESGRYFTGLGRRNNRNA